jgi:hypothetical protein
MQFGEPTDLTQALEIARDRGLLPTTLSSDQIAEWDDELKRLAVFSARTNHAGYLQEVKDAVEKLLQGRFNEATARMILQQKLQELQYNPELRGFPGLEEGIPPADAGSLRDLSSDARTQLILRTQMRQMANRGYREQGTTPTALRTFPAWELIRIYPRLVPRGSVKSRSAGWPERWSQAGGELHSGRMVATKSDKIWAALGDRSLFDDAIGTDYPPFAFNSGMGWRQIDRATCQRIGVPFTDNAPAPAAPLDDAEVSVKQFDPEFLRGLREALDVEIKEGYARLKNP